MQKPCLRALPVLVLTGLGVLAGCSPQSTVDKPPASSSTQPVSTPPTAQESEPSNKVMLGSADLTSGIPGEGPLKIEEIKEWLAKLENQEVLEVELPLGLALGKDQITGLKENPLTRAKIELGRQLYFDPSLSANVSVSCAHCHHPDEGFARNTQFGVGIEGQTGNRNSPVSYNRILSGPQFWDGRAASLEEQAVGPIANPIEMGNTHDACVECIGGIDGYKMQFDSVFGPGDITIDKVALAIAAFERALVTSPAPFDYYERFIPFEKMSPEDIKEMEKDDEVLFAIYQTAKEGMESHPMSESAKRGYALFKSDKTRCSTCHVGANLTDEKYHNLGVGMDKENPDLGRYEITKEEKDRGAFKTPTIRNVALSPPYMHDGSQKTLEEVVEWYAKGGHPNKWLSDKIRKLDLTDQDKADLVAFMKEGAMGEFPKVATDRLPES